MSDPTNRRLHWLGMIVLVLAVVGAVAAIAGKVVWRNLRGDIVAHYVANLSEEQKQQLYQDVAGMSATLWDATPEPHVAVLGRRNHETVDKGVKVRINNAGFRSSRSFEPRSPENFRIVCLGDSFVFGTGAPEADRFCDQLEGYYRDQDIRPGH